ncbi:diphosphate--fructose-6-phosphate 1-phosphotransferase [Neobacillus mesonae]|uniref:diphosphate--fructose-6-phosphate 1-phosphotransferase n=1 Tax=Neobacillus mesonae TaxID=1193713 RepID=UPI00203CDB43|nr:diphosphate--fructose-6-phosphate 1-phosphotransferase [Neobacillus mesonae]MCM3569869.1 diphosphate--fructose-6-phosphate 1-phosphotransferase [Neobacillus mesonae]
MNGNCLIVQSGGPTAVINNSLIGIINGALDSSFKGQIYGAVGGLHGLLNESFVNLNDLSNQERYRLRWTPGAALGSWRYKLTPTDIEIILKVMKKRDIRYFFCIGGNGSMNVAQMIDEQAKKIGYELIVIGVPKSIDNDLMGTDHSPGFGSAAKFLATCMLDIKMDMKSYMVSNRITIIETMGRHAGWLAGACSLVGDVGDNCQDLIYIPEVPFDVNALIRKIQSLNLEKKSAVVVVSEGIKDHQGNLCSGNNLNYDILGRPKLGGVSSYLNSIIKEETGIHSHLILPSTWQRSSMLFAAKTDVSEAYNAGIEAWSFAKRNYTGVMIGLKRKNLKEYEISYETVPLSEIGGKERFVPINWYNQENCSMSKDFIDYVRPIIKGELMLPSDNGLPVYGRVI